MPETAADPPSAKPFSGQTKFPVQSRKFPVGREFHQASHRVAALCCFSEAESRDFNELVLISSCKCSKAGADAQSYVGRKSASAFRHLSGAYRLWNGQEWTSRGR